MELNGGHTQRQRLDDSYWQQPLDSEYWEVLLTQGEVAPMVGATAPAAGAAAGGDRLDTTAKMSTGLPAEEESALEESRWELAQAVLDRGETFSLRVSGANRGGLLVDWNGLQGFVPASHLKIMPRHSDQQERISELAGRVNDWLTVRLIEVDPVQKRLVFSERAAATDAETATSVLSRLSTGDICTGMVTNVTSFGAFVDLGGVEGLIHISEISWDRVRHPADLLRPGMEVSVYVMGVNPEQERIALSLKRLRPNPWSLVDKQYQVGQIVEGTVTNVVTFGAFVRLEEGLEGLIHISELAEGNFLHPRNVVHEGDVVKVRVLNIDTSNHRLGLSLRQAYSAGQVT
jgi:small subunit ribosomal protein S1